MKRNQSGFTLIEIAIVLVIIGLLLGGVMKGQELINSAKVKNLAADFKNTSLFIYSYQDKFKALPGDDALAASHVTGATPATTPLAADGGGIGNGRIDGQWDSTTPTDESYLFWQHIRLAGIATGITNTADVTAYRQRNTQGGIIGITNTTTGFVPITGIKGAYIICSADIQGKFAKQLDIMLDDGNTAAGSLMTKSATDLPEANVDDATLYTVCMGV